MSDPKTVGALLQVGERVLADSTHIFEDHDNRQEAEELLAFSLRCETDELEPSRKVAPAIRQRFLSLVARRAAGEPLPMITGSIEFYGLDLKVRPGTFVPRPSSELTVARAVRRLRNRRDPVVVDLCTGAGPIALGIADEVSEAEVWGADISSKELDLGRFNARRLGIDNVHFRCGDMFEALPKRLRGSVDVITGHIPYVPPDEVDDLPSEVKEHEPLFTLTDDSRDGLSLIRGAIEQAPEWLEAGGWMLLEVSDDLPAKIRRIFRRAGFEDHGVAEDEDRLSVVIEARKSRGGRRAAR
ncbi:MAG TPA: peptide chain release factor N(5)-glutamine methyltransferase [Actinomycetota bacterium]|nr:peptide chain release factor N(5)-glutamine methyltransferase [Actinomycetota bacterium]